MRSPGSSRREAARARAQHEGASSFEYAIMAALVLFALTLLVIASVQTGDTAISSVAGV